MGSSRFWLNVADEESKSIPHEFPRSHWPKATGQCVKERYLSVTMGNVFICFIISAGISSVPGDFSLFCLNTAHRSSCLVISVSSSLSFML